MQQPRFYILLHDYFISHQLFTRHYICFEANWRGKQINVTVKVKFSAFRTICGFNFIPWKRVIFFYMGSFSQKGNVTPEKIEKFITLINRLVDELLSNDIYSLPKTTSVSFPFSSFLFRSQHQHSIPGITSSIYGHLL
jgi:hypothetical protein